MQSNNKLTSLIRKAERKQSKLRLALIGPSGSGKTMSALLIAKGMGAKTLVVDTENGSADLYADVMDYDVINMSAPYMPDKYIQAIQAAEEAGYDVVILDSLSHAWAGEGGLLDKHGKIESGGKNSFAAWRDVTPDHNKLVESIIQSKIHVIATMRAKTEYVVEQNERGKSVPKKVGLAPVQRDGLEYEFTTVLNLDIANNAHPSKDRTRLFVQPEKVSTETGAKLIEWLNAGKEEPKEQPQQ